MAQNKGGGAAQVQEVPPQQQMLRCGVVPQDLLLQVLDFIRDVPAPRKQTDPLVAGLQTVQYANFPIGVPQGKTE